MPEMSIGQLARASGFKASTLRYYEKAGLLPPPPRASKQRRYDSAIIGRIEIIKVALNAGFTIAETRTFLSGFSSDTPPAARWRALAERKLAEIDALMRDALQMKRILETSFHCGCLRMEDCERWARAGASKTRPATKKRRTSRARAS